MRRQTRSLDGDGWQIRSHPGTDAALAVAARTAAGRAAPSVHGEHTGGSAVPPGWLPARVPGSILDDLMRAGEVADVYHERNSLLAEWVPERAWTYRRPFEIDALADDERAWLTFDGVDHAGHVVVDGRRVARHEGMFVPFEVPLEGDLARPGRHELAVVIEPAPPSEPQVGRTSLVRIHKTRMGYGWDFCPRLVHQGIWQSVRLETAGPVRIRSILARPTLADDLASATVAVQVALDIAPGDTAATRVDVEIAGAARGRAVGAGDGPVVEFSLAVDRPATWWPNGLGSATLHELVARVSRDGALLDERSVWIGFRRIERVTNEGAPSDARPWTFIVNGREVELLGWNWTPLDALYGVARPERLEHLLGLVVASHANLLRVWGGGLIETEAFYDACDRLGILVWQELGQSSSGIDDEPARDSEFVELMRSEAEAIVPLRRNHPSLAIWCGGNELQDAYGPLEDSRSPVLAAVHGVVARLDPDRVWLPTSPSGPRFGNRLADIVAAPDELHDVHGPWEHQGLRRHNALWDGGTSLFNGEFGVEGMTNRRSHEQLIELEHRWPADRSNVVYRHLGDWWNNADLVQEAFGGRLGDLEQLRRASQRLQADGLRYAIEANRRRWPRNTGSIPWQLHESFPNAWSTAVVDHAGEPKPAFHAAARAFAPTIVCARFDSWALDGEARITATPFAWGAIGPASLSVRAVTLDGAVLAESLQPAVLDGRRPVTPGATALELGPTTTAVVFLDLALIGRGTDGDRGELARNRYLLARDVDYGALLDVDPAAIHVTCHDLDDTCSDLRLEHRGGPAAIGVRVVDDRPGGAIGWAVPDDDGFDLLPGERRTVRVRWVGTATTDRRLRIDGWNVRPVVIG